MILLKFLMLAVFAVSMAINPINVNVAYAEGSHGEHDDHGDEHSEEEEQERGSHGGKLFRDDDFAIELTIYEQGVPPEFRVYAYDDDEPLDPAKVQLTIELKRLDGEVNRFDFTPQGDLLVGNGVVTEPHSFDVKINAAYDGKSHEWKFASYEGRTEISEQAAQESGVKTEKAKPGIISEYAKLTGRIMLNRNTTAHVRARFAGIVKTVNVNWGEDVKKGQVLATIESNESLRSYNITAPIDGVVLARNTNVGDVADAESLFTVADLSNVWAEFHVFPRDLENVKKDQVVEVHTLGKGKETVSKISMLLPTADALSQTVIAVVPLDNPDGKWRPGMTVEGDVLIDQREVPLAVRTSALQKFRDFTVVFAKFGEQYEVRMLELGTNDGEWVEVLEGLKPNTEYVTENSFLIKADIEKSGASHDH
jgi:cobalt-zinc-cadmium efflux system membrane fusion protein